MNVLARLLLAVLLAGCAAGGASAPATPPAGAALSSPATASAPPTATPAATPTARATVEPTPTVAPIAPEPYAVNLYREGAFVSQFTDYWCLPAAMQTMMNIIDGAAPDTTRETQERLYWQARDLSTETLRPNGKGAQPEGWANSLNAEGYGPYEVRVEPTLEEAVALAARQLRLTGKPVGLLTWRGAHSWVMSGFEATADPLHFDDFEVTGVWIQDVWYPRVSRIWGESEPPDTLVPIEELGEDYRKYRRPYRRHPDKDGQYVLVVPLAETAG